jgi:predicted outer membrane protein
VIREDLMLRCSLARRAGVVVAGATALLALLGGPVAAAPPALNSDDMALLSGVQHIALWETQASQLVAQKGVSQQVRTIGQQIGNQRSQLDNLVTDAAGKLGVTLPEAPTVRQAWLAELRTATGARFDQVFVTGLRGSLGQLLPVMMAVRSATRNPVVRKLADQSNLFVINQMTLLESTGLVQFDKLPPGGLPPAQDLSSLGMAQADAGVVPPASPATLWALFVGMAAVACLASVRMFRSRQ